MDLPHPTYAYPDRRTVILRCKTTNVAIVMSLLYNMLLIGWLVGVHRPFSAQIRLYQRRTCC